MSYYTGLNHAVIDGKVSEALKKKYPFIDIVYAASPGVPKLHVVIDAGQLFAYIESINRQYDFATDAWTDADADTTVLAVTPKSVARQLRRIKAAYRKEYGITHPLEIERFVPEGQGGVSYGLAPKFAKHTTIVHRIEHDGRVRAAEELRRRVASGKIKRAFKACYENPEHPVCRRRLTREYDALSARSA